MANKDNLRISTVQEGLKIHTKAVLDSIDNASRFASQLTDAQDGDTSANWSRILYGTANTGSVTLTVDATAKTVSCLSGAGLFSNFRVGRDVQLNLFSQAGNNQTTEITAQTADSITIANATGLVSETDTTARARENATLDERTAVDAVIATIARFNELKDALDNVAVTTADRRTDLTDWIW